MVKVSLITFKILLFVVECFLGVFMLQDELVMPVPAFHVMNYKFPELFVSSSTE